MGKRIKRGSMVEPPIQWFQFLKAHDGEIHHTTLTWRSGSASFAPIPTGAIGEETEAEEFEFYESADTNRQNNFWPPKPVKSRFQHLEIGLVLK